MACNTYKFHRFILIEDSCDADIHKQLRSRYAKKFEVILNDTPMFQTATIDKACSLVDTNYTFHCGDTWKIHGRRFVQHSLDILAEEPKFLQVWIRDSDNCRHPRLSEFYKTQNGTPFHRLAPDHHGWKGFSWSPRLRRTTDYRVNAPFSKHVVAGSASPHQKAAGLPYHKLGFAVVTPVMGYCRRIDRDRHNSKIDATKAD